MMTENDLIQIQVWVKSEWLIAPSHVNTMIAEIRRLQNEILCEKEMVKKTGAQVDTLLKLVDIKDKHLQEFEKDARRYRWAVENPVAALNIIGCCRIKYEADYDFDEAMQAEGGQAKFKNVTCSQCGGEFGPADHGFSSCMTHKNRGRSE